MDIVFNIPVIYSDKSYIAVIVDKMSRQAHLISLLPKFDAVDLVHLYLHRVYRHLGLHSVLILSQPVSTTTVSRPACAALIYLSSTKSLIFDHTIPPAVFGNLG